MARRVRTTKNLAQRIDLNYFKYPHWLRRWKFLLTLTAVAIGVVWIAWAAVARNENIYSSGPVSSPHAVIGQQCNVCHLQVAGVFREHVTNEACITCHDGPIHSLRQMEEPTCGACHVEHKGVVRLADVDDKNCTECHSDLKARGSAPTVVRHINSFNTDHPDLAVLREKMKDPGTIKLNHQVHLRKGLRGPKGQTQLECEDCHRTAAINEPWPYGEPQFRTAAAKKDEKPSLGPRSERAFMVMPVKYSQGCAWCHPLYFDKRIEEAAPHDKPEVVHAFVVKKFQEYLAKHPTAWREPEEQVERRIPGKPFEEKPAARSPQEWLTQRIAKAESLLWGKTCKECHSLSAPSVKPEASASANVALPGVAKDNMVHRWLKNAEFDHEAHRMMECDACHAARTSTETSDVLMPAIVQCQQCHAPGKAESRCYECHNYHDWTKERHVKGKYSIPQLLRSARSARSGAEAGR